MSAKASLYSPQSFFLPFSHPLICDVPVSMSLIFFSLRVQVEFYVNENTFKERLKLFFIKNQRSSELHLLGVTLSVFVIC